MYTINKLGVIVRDSDNACIPADDANLDYKLFLKWKAEGGLEKVDSISPDDEKKAKIQELQIELLPFLIESVLMLLDGDKDKIAASKAKLHAKIIEHGVTATDVSP